MPLAVAGRLGAVVAARMRTPMARLPQPFVGVISSTHCVPEQGSGMRCVATARVGVRQLHSLPAFATALLRPHALLLNSPPKYMCAHSNQAPTSKLHTTSTSLQSQAPRLNEPAEASGPAAAAGLGDLQLDDLIVTARAGRRIAAIRAKAIADAKPNADRMHLRVKVEGGGCSGFQYQFLLEDTPTTDEDKIFNRDGSIVVVDTVSLDLVKGSTLDWDESMMKSAFVISNNPNAESSCGCKSSFAPKMS